MPQRGLLCSMREALVCCVAAGSREQNVGHTHAQIPYRL